MLDELRDPTSRASTFVLRRVFALQEDGGFGPAADVLVSGGVIEQVGDLPSVPGAVDVDTAGLWLMPGVIDCHVHLTMSSMNPHELLTTSLSEKLLEGAANAKRTLECGVTTARDAGGADAGFRAAIEKGYVDGPRVQVAVVLLSQTGGHADGFLAGPALEASAGYLIPDYPGRPPYLIDGLDSARRVVRAVLRAGADWIKLCTTGGFNSPHDEPAQAEMTIEEISVAVDEARRGGRPVMAHAFGGDGLLNAVLAGVRSIEHGAFLTEEQAVAMAQAGCWLVPTLAIAEEAFRRADAGELPDYFAEKVARLRGGFGEAVRIARAAGVRIALGSDFFARDQHGGNLREIALLHESGLTAEEALLAATYEGARLCGVEDRLGRIAPGYVFDALLLAAEPHPATLASTRPIVVFKGGAPIFPVHARHPNIAPDCDRLTEQA